MVGCQLGLKGLFRLCRPISGKHDVQGPHNGALQTRHQLNPLTAHFVVPLFTVGRLNNVLGAGKGNSSIHHEDFSVVAQIRPAPLTFDRHQGQHTPPLDFTVFEPTDHAQISRNPQGTDVIKKHPNPHATCSGRFQFREQFVSARIGAHDVKLCVDIIGGSADFIGHGIQGLLISLNQLNSIATQGREIAQILIQLHGGFHPRWTFILWNQSGDALGSFHNALVNRVLGLPPPPGKPEISKHEKQDQANIGEEKDA